MAKAARGTGIGTQLLKEAESVARSFLCARIELDSAFHREQVHRFYEANGFENRAFLFSKPLT